MNRLWDLVQRRYDVDGGGVEAKPIRLITRVMSSDAFVSSDNNKMDVVF